jgi:hypothetical protein
MVIRRRGVPDAGDAAKRERQRAPAEPVPRPPPGFFGFLDGVLGSEVKTRRLGYLVRQFAGGISFILVALAGLGYILAYNAPIATKTGISLGSVVVVTVGGFGLRRWRATRLASAVKPPTGDQDDENSADSLTAVSTAR